MKQKKFLLSVFSIILSLISVFAFGSCKSETGSQDKQDGGVEKIEGEEHNYTYGICSICGLEEELGDYFKFTFNEDENSYTVGIFDEATHQKCLEYCKSTNQEMTECTTWPEEIQKVIDAVGDELIIPSGYKGLPITHIQDNAFMLCNFETCIIPDTIVSIGAAAFGLCRNLKSVVLPDSVKEIEGWAFCFCYSLTNVEITESVIAVGDYPFADCDEFVYNEYNGGYYIGNTDNPYIVLIETTWDELPTYTVHPQTKTIACWAFEGCSTLAKVEIPASVISINSCAFEGCTTLTTMIFHGTVEQWNAIKKELHWWDDDIPATKIVCANGEVAL
ncbi:MAG: leucine-rich repeat domain-containing protein [Clostridia bacterium]|nr:leucine-rich repeat domain-containing protein [Clostridia bacterium]